MKPYWFVVCLGLGACGHAGPFVVAPEERPVLTDAPRLYLLPFEDRRPFKELWREPSSYLRVEVKAEGLSLGAKVWQEPPYGDLAFLWHRSLERAFAASGLPVAAALTPPADAAQAFSEAAASGAKLLLRGRLTRLEIFKRGADPLFNTNFRGTYYDFQAAAKVEMLEAADGRVLVAKDWRYTRRFFDPRRLGGDERSTFPPFFLAGLATATDNLAGDADLRRAAGLPPLTPTPTLTPTPFSPPPMQGAAAPPPPTVTATPEPTEWWVNPKTGRRVDPRWNFDPEDGTPRKYFVLRRAPSPTPSPVPSRAGAR